MSPARVVFDTMVLFQWAISGSRRHGGERAVDEGRVISCLGAELDAEIRALLARPAIRAKTPRLTDEIVDGFLNELRKRSVWIEPVPSLFRHSTHSKDDHIFNLSIAAGARFLVTWETRHLDMERTNPADFLRLRARAPALAIINPPLLLGALAQTDAAESPVD